MFFSFHEGTLIIGKMVERKSFLAIQSICIVYPNKENMIIVPITKRMEIIMSIQNCPISWKNIIYRENGGRKSFSCKSKSPILCILTWRSHFTVEHYYKENGGKKSFSCKFKASRCCFLTWRI